jgi:wyosine [tRNA(Phe)-imidazoG37] synthetase (radical SAM superfamily)
VPFKTCSYDCIYCQLGRTTNKTTERKEYVPVDDVLEELAEKLRAEPGPDYVGLAGSGEPTLHARIGDLIAGIKRLTSVPVAVLTNGSMLWRSDVRAGIAEADLFMPSLDAGTPRRFERVNRPHRDISFEKMVDGLVAFGALFRGKVWLEVFVLAGITDRREEIARIAAVAKSINPERVQLNTVSRPPADRAALGVPVETLERLRLPFSGSAEVIAECRRTGPPSVLTRGNAEDDISTLLSRRPCTVDDIATGLGLPPNEVVKHVDALRGRGAARVERRGDAVYYRGIGSRRAS